MSLNLRHQDGCAVLTLDRPQALNALSFALIREIGAALDEVAGSDARALIVTGAGDKAFCAGADIKELQDRPLLEQKRGAELGQAVFAKLDRLPVASIALLNGYAFGGGLELALACNFRLAAPNAALGLPEIKLGLIPGYGGTQRLPRLIGESRALEMILTGRAVKAEEALRIGLVNRLVEPPLLDAAIAFAHEFCGYGRLAQQFAREAVQRAAAATLESGLRIEADLSTLAYRTADAEEGMRAFVEKRKPQFRDG
ncbi:enoyl-CoA hydratase/isomerase family protein [Solimonas soli]|uniref:enoyl-CoA hydratase/isomerase family protein n=1 Tax=Solimonas soli TaxID=413479 RepID=UPI000486EB02|nr:enoyl-CoA hydratase-related protein [Solimonas soli]